MADVASREGLIQVMRDMLAAPEQFDWLATRLEIARKLRNDPAFQPGLGRTVGRTVGGHHRAAAPAEAGRPAARRRSRATCCRPIWTWCSTAWWRDWRPATTRTSQCGAGSGRGLGAPAALIQADERSSRRARAVVGPAAAAHRGARLAAACCGWTRTTGRSRPPASGCSHRPRRRCAARAATDRALRSASSSTPPSVRIDPHAHQG